MATDACDGDGDSDREYAIRIGSCGNNWYKRMEIENMKKVEEVKRKTEEEKLERSDERRLMGSGRLKSSSQPD